MNSLKRFFAFFITLSVLLSVLIIPGFAAGNIMHGIGFVNTDALRLRSEPNTSSEILDTAAKDECVVVISESGDWYHVNYNLQEGYMHKDYLDVLTCENAELGYGEVNAAAVNMRSGPGTFHKAITVSSKGDSCYIIGLNNGWYKVIYAEKICYIRSDYVDLTECPYENCKSPNSPKFFRHGKCIGAAPSASAIGNCGYNNNTCTNTGHNGHHNGHSWTSQTASGQDIVNEAAKYLGTPYAYGGASPSGFDCSGLVYYVLKTLGYDPYRTPNDQYSQGTYVSKEELQPGDIVFFSNTGGSGITHVGIYAGNGQFIHSPNSRSVVTYTDLTSGYWAQHYYGARRFH